jgi:2-polyprenyl-3-methyl-5-hydroxy-6-metoxy-1,4-benzoquinol methylase
MVRGAGVFRGRRERLVGSILRVLLGTHGDEAGELLGGSRRMSGEPRDRALRYRNDGNASALAMIPRDAVRVLDVGCGAGDNARVLKSRGHLVWGVTTSAAEAEVAGQHCEGVWVGDVERMRLPPLGEAMAFDALLMSHVLEHLAAPRETLRRLAPMLRPGGLLVAAVPNMAFWGVRLRILLGDWSRDELGFFDRTHLQFWSYATRGEILSDTPFEVLVACATDGVIPLRPIRRTAPLVASRIDRIANALLPNLVGVQVVLVARRCP